VRNSKAVRESILIDSIDHLLSTRQLWHFFWNKKSGIQVSREVQRRNYNFEIKITLFLFYVDMIGTILGDQWNFQNNSDLSLLEQAHNLVLELEKGAHLEEYPEFPSDKHAQSTPSISRMFERKLRPTFCREKLSLNWKWIAILIMRSENQHLKNIFFQKGNLTLHQTIQTFFNSIFFYSIRNLNIRLEKYYKPES
jgi:hypothetical protein